MRLKLKRCILSFAVLILLLKALESIFINRIGDSKIVDEFVFPREDSIWLENLKRSRSDEIPTVIVEEHYEVLQYWFQAADLDFIPRSKNVLLHIDGHVDGAIPYNVDKIPWFRSPRDSAEVSQMMQRNDMFIVAAVMTGFIDHVIWVWPTWDEEDHDGQNWKHLKYDVEIGTCKGGMSDDGQSIEVTNLCYCWASVETHSKKPEDGQWQCHARNTDCEEAVECPKIAREKCVTQSRVVLEIIGESVASAVLDKEKWPEEKGLILDVDEDFFGCWSDVFALYEAGITQEKLDVLNDLINELFCATTSGEETEADRLYVAIIAFVKLLKSRRCGEAPDIGCLSKIDTENILIENEEDITAFTKSKQTTQIFCSAEESTGGSKDKMEGLAFHSLYRYLLNFSIKQLELLQQLGICFEVSPSSPNFAYEGKVHLCHGENIPNKTLVNFHLPSENEIGARAIKLKEIMTSTGKRPNIVSTCRSVRDGYTPKPFADLIESKVIDSLSKSYRSVNVSGVYYDSNLLGGKQGWKERSQPLVPYFLEFLETFLNKLPLFVL